MKTTNLCIAQIVAQNPILYDGIDVKKEYFCRLKCYLRIGGWERRKYEKSEIALYKTAIFSHNSIKEKHDINYYYHYILFDLIHILGYETYCRPEEKWKTIKKQYLSDFSNGKSEEFDRIIRSVQGDGRQLLNLKKRASFEQEKSYIEFISKNIVFRNQRPYNVMVTATMSAGKSTFINSLIGKYVCLSQNMACTSKIHSITNKAFEDGYSTEYDHDLIMTAGREELLHDNENNTSNVIYVATSFDSGLADQRIVINDSPGVNYSGDKEHKKVAEQLIKRRKYHLLIYVMNATQLGTNDDAEHLAYIKRTIGRTPIIFVMNKVDVFNPEEESLQDIIERQLNYLKAKGFKDPIVCPVSARAGCLVKQYRQHVLTKSEKHELYNHIDKFEKMKLDEYYRKIFPQIQVDTEKEEEEQLLNTCGISYIEQIIKIYSNGGE